MCLSILSTTPTPLSRRLVALLFEAEFETAPAALGRTANPPASQPPRPAFSETPTLLQTTGSATRRAPRTSCHRPLSAAPFSSVSRCLNVTGEGMSADQQPWGGVVNSCSQVRHRQLTSSTTKEMMRGAALTISLVQAQSSYLPIMCAGIQLSDSRHARAAQHASVVWNYSLTSCRINGQAPAGTNAMCWSGNAAVAVAVDGTVILLHPPLPLVGVSIGMERGRQQNDSLAAG